VAVLLPGRGSGTVWVSVTVRVTDDRPAVGTIVTSFCATQREGSGPVHENAESAVRLQVQSALPTLTALMTPPVTEIVSLVEEGRGFGPPLEPLTWTIVGWPAVKIGVVRMLA
jgi:hypothetical protein